MNRVRWILLLFLAVPFTAPAGGELESARAVRGMTISCQTWGIEWGTDSFAAELDELKQLGVNWIAIHPYAWIGRDGSLSWTELDTTNPPEWLARPIREAKARNMSLFIKPHIGYWGSPFSWRGEIDYPDRQEREQFFGDYKRWILQVAECTKDAGAFAVGTELALLNRPEDEPFWRDLIEAVRKVTKAHLTYAANWDVYKELRFWDALDVVGVQAYFPIAAGETPTDGELSEGWQGVVDELSNFHEQTGKPVVLTELGYNRSLSAAREPWSHVSANRADATSAAELQRRLLRVGLEALAPEREWLRGAFLWKWFAGEAPRANFKLDTPDMRDVISSVWRATASEQPK